MWKSAFCWQIFIILLKIGSELLYLVLLLQYMVGKSGMSCGAMLIFSFIFHPVVPCWCPIFICAGSPLSLLVVYDLCLKSMVVYCSLWQSKVVYGSLWQSMSVYGRLMPYSCWPPLLSSANWQFYKLPDKRPQWPLSCPQPTCTVDQSFLCLKYASFGRTTLPPTWLSQKTSRTSFQ